ncbi:MAG: S9 family peptidase [Acidobacteriota bacterium]|nr:S9 family peptidase [Acidobacteriota bacterium]
MNPRACAAVVAAVVAVIGTSRPVGAQIQPFQGPDLYRLQTVGDVQISPDGQRVAYSVRKSDRPGRPYSEVWVMETASGEVSKLGGEGGVASGPRWSPDGREIAYIGVAEGQAGLVVARADGSSAKFLAPITGTNHPLPSAGERITWSPDGNRIAFVSATKAPVDVDNGDPIVITRYLYKPTASEGMTRFNDNRRVHIFIFDRLANRVHQLTSGRYYEHSIDWSPRGDEIVFISNHEPDPDRTFNYDIHAVRVENGEVRRVTDTASAEYQPKWSPDGRSIAYLGTRRSFTSSETTLEDTHGWVVDADGRNRRELGGSVDNRQRNVRWAADGQSLYFTVQARGNVHLFRLPVSGGSPQMLVIDRGRLGAWSVANDGTIAYAFTPPSGPTELYMRHEGLSRTLTSLNAELLAERAVAEVEAFTFSSFDRRPIEAFLTKPVDLNPASRHPLVVVIHGGPHGQQGAAFNAKAQVYAGHGWATLMVNYRGSTGYGQELTDAIFKDQNGGEAKDVLAGVDAALDRYRWLDADRLAIEGGSYGGQLTNWIITQTDRFKAAIPRSSISNLVSFNYMAYYHDYLAVEFGAYPHEEDIVDLLWERSPIRYARNVTTPTMLVHGENDNDVPIAEAEQFYIALRDVGVDAVMVRYPREGHGIRETAHQVDLLERSITWYERYFGRRAATTTLR